MTRPKRRALSLRLREDLVEILEETAEELVVGRNRLVELALERYFADLELPTRTP